MSPKKTTTTAQKKKTFWGLKPEPSVERLVQKEITSRRLRTDSGEACRGAIKIVLEDCIVGHLGRKAKR